MGILAWRLADAQPRQNQGAIAVESPIVLRHASNVTISGITAATGRGVGVELRGVFAADQPPQTPILHLHNVSHVVVRFLRVRCTNLACVGVGCACALRSRLTHVCVAEPRRAASRSAAAGT